MTTIQVPASSATEPPTSRTDRWRARWLEVPVVGRALIAVAIAVGLANAMEAGDEWWQYRPVVVAQEAARNAQKPVTVLPMAVADQWGAGEHLTEGRVKARWAEGNAYFEPVYFALPDAPGRTLPSARDRCYYFPIHDPIRAGRGGGISHIGRMCFRGSVEHPSSASFLAVVR
jgi:hypothetical protein